MIARPPTREFGRRKPALVEPGPPVKRSGHVALLLMGTLAVGGTAYALIPSQQCGTTSPSLAGPALPRDEAACAARGSSGSGYSRSAHFSFFGSSSGGTPGEASTGITRGGFGSFAHAFGMSGRS